MNISTLEEHMKRTVKIIVIGAGIAGLAAAERLIKRGFTNVEIFEASDRIGGRIYTKDFGNGWVEMGAQWLHGEKDNVAYQHAARRDLILPPENEAGSQPTAEDSDSDSDSGGPATEEVFCTLADGVLSDQTAAYAAYDFIAEKLENCPAEEHDAPPISPGGGRVHLERFIEQEFAPLLEDKSSEPKDASDPDATAAAAANLALKRSVLEWFKKFQCCVEGCDSLDEMSLDSFLEQEECQGDMWINFRHGYRTLVASLSEGIPREGVVRLRRPVIAIRLTQPESSTKLDGWDGMSAAAGLRPVQVRCEDGSVHDADHVIVTVPLGYLKEHAHDMFEPPLSDVKMKAIQKMGFGTVDKIFLEFEEPVAARGIEGYFLLWPETQTETDKGDRKSEVATDHFFGEAKSNSSSDWWRNIHSIEPSLFASNVLCWWISGSEARQMEALSDEEVQKACAELFRRFTKKDKLPKVKSITRSKWFENEYSRGSYSYLTSELPSANKSCRVLSEPIFANANGKQRPVILFGGEATHPYYFSTVHGALETGRREAVRIVASYATKRTTRYERLDSGGSF